MQKMLAARPPWPVDDVPAMLKRVTTLPAASHKKLTHSFRRRVDELRVAQECTPGGTGITDPDYTAFLASHGGDGARADNNFLASLKTRRAFADFKLGLAQSRGDLAGVKDATEQLRYISSVIYDEETLAQKLGREIGDQLPRAEAERIARAIPYWCLRCVDEILVSACKPIADASASGPLFHEEIRTILEPILLSTRVFQPIVRALQNTTALALPAWYVAAHGAGLAAVMEDADTAFAQLYATPPPAPAAPSISEIPPPAPPAAPPPSP